MSDAGHDAIAEVLVPPDALRERVAELGAELSRLSREGADPLLLVGVLKGSAMFMADLVRAMWVDVEVDFMSLSAYSSGRPGVVRIVKDLEGDVGGRDVVIVEDIVDTGFTLNFLRRSLDERGARSLRTVALLDKSARRILPVPIEHRGFDIPDVFVVGYGLDFQGRYRNVPQILAVRDVARLANDPLVLVERFFGVSGS